MSESAKQSETTRKAGKSANGEAAKAAADFGAQARHALENGMETLTGKAKEAWETVQERIKSVRENATETLGAIKTSVETTGNGMRDMNMKLIEAVTADANAYFSTIRKVTTAKSIKEAFEIQSEYVRSQFQTNLSNARSFGEMAQGVATESLKPLRERAMSFSKFN